VQPMMKLQDGYLKKSDGDLDFSAEEQNKLLVCS
jgi:hypothetical protein